VSPRPLLRIGIVGCGNIAGPYARDIAAAPELELAAATDLDPTRAHALTERHGGEAVGSIEELLERVDLVVNLTVQRAHAEVSRRALEAGLHVHSEKPLAMTPEEAWSLVDLAERQAVRLSGAPTTLLNEAQQTAWREIRDGRIGRVRAVLAQTQWGWIETWHPAPAPFYEVGPLVDVGVYPLALVTAMLGPVRRVHAIGRVLAPDRVDRDGRPFHVPTADFQVLVLQLKSDVMVRLTSSFYVGQQSRENASLEFHGDEGSLWLGHFFHPDARVEIARLGDSEQYRAVRPVREPPREMDWARALLDLATAIRDGRPHRMSGAHAAHIVDVVAAAATSIASDGAPVEVGSSFPQPQPMEWAES
jgi:predicted dehydrogenase